jgi:hypothetical protein
MPTWLRAGPAEFLRDGKRAGKEPMRLLGFMLLSIAITATAWTFGGGDAHARSCSDQNGVCVSSCMANGMGRGRRANPHPMSAEFCRRHCARWYSGCLKSGCWNGDLAKACGLSRS